MTVDRCVLVMFIDAGVEWNDEVWTCAVDIERLLQQITELFLQQFTFVNVFTTWTFFSNTQSSRLCVSAGDYTRCSAI